MRAFSAFNLRGLFTVCGIALAAQLLPAKNANAFTFGYAGINNRNVEIGVEHLGRRYFLPQTSDADFRAKALAAMKDMIKVTRGMITGYQADRFQNMTRHLTGALMVHRYGSVMWPEGMGTGEALEEERATFLEEAGLSKEEQKAITYSARAYHAHSQLDDFIYADGVSAFGFDFRVLGVHERHIDEINAPMVMLREEFPDDKSLQRPLVTGEILQQSKERVAAAVVGFVQNFFAMMDDGRIARNSIPTQAKWFIDDTFYLLYEPHNIIGSFVDRDEARGLLRQQFEKRGCNMYCQQSYFDRIRFMFAALRERPPAP